MDEKQLIIKASSGKFTYSLSHPLKNVNIIQLVNYNIPYDENKSLTFGSGSRLFRYLSSTQCYSGVCVFGGDQFDLRSVRSRKLVESQELQ
jgi:hypothetical protein